MIPRNLHLRPALVGLALLLAVPAVCRAGPAPPLTQVRVTDVLSSGYPNQWDVIPPGAVSTPNDHSGPYLYVAVYEQGYANPGSRLAQFNGRSMTLYQSIPVYGPYPYIVGYIQVYEFVGPFTSGTFSYQATSLVVPIRTYSTRLYIR